LADNIWLTREPLGVLGTVIGSNLYEDRRATFLFAGAVKTDLRPDVPVALLPSDEKEIVEILKP